MFQNQKLLEKIKQKRELAMVSDSLISEMLDSYAKKYNIDLKNLKPLEEKIIIKEIRAELRNYTGRFQKSPKQKKKLLKEESWENLLQTHTSTAERLLFYPKLKTIIKSLHVKKILDLGCGLNPLAIASREYYYIASDINEEDLSIVGEFFRKKNIPGETLSFDLRKIQDNANELPQCDLCLLFKVLDILAGGDRKMRNVLAERILEKIKASYFLISFSTRKISGKEMRSPRRNWFEKILAKKNLRFRTFASTNEIFYLTHPFKE